jgi:putative endonuclease
MAAHNDKGKQGEELALANLVAKGYSVLHTNWRYQKTEVDIIAKIGNILVFIEVKTRNSEYFGLPESFVTEAKKRSFGKASEAYCQINQLNDVDIRYDIMAVIINKKTQEVQHFEDAFFPAFYP